MIVQGQRDEFDLMAEWSADVLQHLPRKRAIAGACNGSASPTALAWLAESLRLSSADHVLDVGCGLGGAGAWVQDRYGARITGVDPMESAARRGAALFGHHVVVGSAVDLPFAHGALDCAWMLGALDTIDDQPAALRSIRDVLVPGGRLGLLAYVARAPLQAARVPEGNRFVGEDELMRMLADCAFAVLETFSSAELLDAPVDWKVEREFVIDTVAQHHHRDERWHRAHRQSRAVAELLRDGSVAPMLVAATPM